MTSNKKLKVFSNTKNGVARCGWPDAYALSSRAFLYLEPGNVVVPTAVESHIANATLSLAEARLRAVLL
ncbi:hypothetical protein, partial [Pseudoalteromonas sp. GABNS16H]|uniref:hypothetical protein n=1 Tax=Pseudoalteromonas sp. GABNS16H TaxID=3025325 RepID=UPI0023630D71